MVREDVFSDRHRLRRFSSQLLAMIPPPSLSLFASLLLCVVLVGGCDSGGSNDPPDPEPAPAPPPAPDTSMSSVVVGTWGLSP